MSDGRSSVARSDARAIAAVVGAVVPTSAFVALGSWAEPADAPSLGRQRHRELSDGGASKALVGGEPLRVLTAALASTTAWTAGRADRSVSREALAARRGAG